MRVQESLAGSPKGSIPVRSGSSGVWGLNATRLTLGNELDSNGACFDCAFVPNDVHVGPTGIHKCHSLCVDVRRAIGIIAFVVGHRSLGHNNEAVPRVGVPTRGTPWQPDAVLHIQVGRCRGGLPRRPILPVGPGKVVKNGEGTKPSFAERPSFVTNRGCCPASLRIIKRRDRNHSSEQEQPRQLPSHSNLLFAPPLGDAQGEDRASRLLTSKGIARTLPGCCRLPSIAVLYRCPGHNSLPGSDKPSTLTGTGTVKMASTTCIFGSGMRFTNNSNILGAGTISDSNPMPITNNGVIKANNTTSTLFIHPDASGFTWRVSSR